MKNKQKIINFIRWLTAVPVALLSLAYLITTNYPQTLITLFIAFLISPLAVKLYTKLKIKNNWLKIIIFIVALIIWVFAAANAYVEPSTKTEAKPSPNITNNSEPVIDEQVNEVVQVEEADVKSSSQNTQSERIDTINNNVNVESNNETMPSVNTEAAPTAAPMVQQGILYDAQVLRFDQLPSNIAEKVIGEEDYFHKIRICNQWQYNVPSYECNDYDKKDLYYLTFKADRELIRRLNVAGSCYGKLCNEKEIDKKLTKASASTVYGKYKNVWKLFDVNGEMLSRSKFDGFDILVLDQQSGYDQIWLQPLEIRPTKVGMEFANNSADVPNHPEVKNGYYLKIN